MAADSVSVPGRILFLAAQPDIVARQLAGEDLTLADAGALRDGVSTDEITPSRFCFHADARLGDYVYLGLKCGEAFPCTEGSVKRGGFSVSVAGKRYGKGSSREHSPYAERARSQNSRGATMRSPLRSFAPGAWRRSPGNVCGAIRWFRPPITDRAP
jgi:3-isopropylmalate/(R)-2-methylmalate dehydratase large subunit